MSTASSCDSPTHSHSHLSLLTLPAPIQALICCFLPLSDKVLSVFCVGHSLHSLLSPKCGACFHPSVYACDGVTLTAPLVRRLRRCGPRSSISGVLGSVGYVEMRTAIAYWEDEFADKRRQAVATAFAHTWPKRPIAANVAFGLTLIDSLDTPLLLRYLGWMTVRRRVCPSLSYTCY